jgi:nucleoside-diphosphate-sugar epimerase
VNVTATAAVAEAAAAVHAHLVHVSSLAAAGPASRARPRRESDPPSPITPYGRSKLLGELAVQRVPGLRWTILRPGVVYGPGDRAMLPLFRWASRGLAPLAGRDDAAYTFLHVADMVRTVEAALDARAAGEVLFVGHPEPVTARSVLDAIEDALGRRVFVVTVPAAFVRATALVGDLVASVSRHPPVINSARARELFAEGFVCVVDRVRDRLGIVAGMDLARGMRATCVWYRSAGWL